MQEIIIYCLAGISIVCSILFFNSTKTILRLLEDKKELYFKLNERDNELLQYIKEYQQQITEHHLTNRKLIEIHQEYQDLAYSYTELCNDHLQLLKRSQN